MGIFLLRNKLAGKESEKENDTTTSNVMPRRKARKQSKQSAKITYETRIRNEIASQGWISAG